MPAPIITLLTDFGRRDHYVATMKGVMLTICPQAELVDISHDIRPQAIPQAAYLLASAALDRLTHHTHTLVIRGSSYRQRQRRKEDPSTSSVLPADSES